VARQPVEKVPDADVAQRAAEEDRRQRALQEGLPVEGRAGGLREPSLLAQFRGDLGRQPRVERGILEPPSP
jgi:hypothetical protein